MSGVRVTLRPPSNDRFLVSLVRDYFEIYQTREFVVVGGVGDGFSVEDGGINCSIVFYCRHTLDSTGSCVLKYVTKIRDLHNKIILVLGKGFANC